MLADELDRYKRRGNTYVDNNIQEIQDLYKEEEQKKELEKERVEDEEVILIKPYEASTNTSRTTSSKTTETSFIHKEIVNLEKYMKFVHSLMQTRIFKLPPHYQSLRSRGEQNSKFWREIAVAFVEEKHNMETS